MKYEDNMKAVSTLQPDYLGFIFYRKSSRFFNTVIPEIPKGIKKTGVFVNASLEVILKKVQLHDLQAIQLQTSKSLGMNVVNDEFSNSFCEFPKIIHGADEVPRHTSCCLYK